MFDWENAIALHAMQGNRASSRGEGKVSWVFSCWGLSGVQSSKSRLLRCLIGKTQLLRTQCRGIRIFHRYYCIRKNRRGANLAPSSHLGSYHLSHPSPPALRRPSPPLVVIGPLFSPICQAGIGKENKPDASPGCCHQQV